MNPADLIFRDTTAHHERFFNFLPEDWRVEIEPYWPQYAHTASIFTLERETAQQNRSRGVGRDGIHPVLSGAEIKDIKEKRRTQTEILGGGIIFRTVSPDTENYRDYAQQQFDEGYHYLAFIWISPDHRGQNLGTEWLTRVHRQYPDQKFWLTIEDYNLVHFYEKSGYSLTHELDLGEWKEWVMHRD